jgi:hypothetical protein
MTRNIIVLLQAVAGKRRYSRTLAPGRHIAVTHPRHENCIAPARMHSMLVSFDPDTVALLTAHGTANDPGAERRVVIPEQSVLHGIRLDVARWNMAVPYGVTVD